MYRIAWLYLKWIFAAPRKLEAASDEGIAGWCLLNKPSFRLSSAAGSDRLIALRQWRRAIAKRPALELPALSSSAEISWVFDNRIVTKELRTEHVSVSTKKNISFFAARDQITAFPGCTKFTDFILLTLLLPLLFTWSFFSKKRRAIAMLFFELREAAGIIRLARKYKVNTFYFFCPFEKDANALYLLLKLENIHVIKIPSPSLLAIHHTQLLSDTLVLTSPYQEDELSLFAQTIRIKTVERWVPEIFLTYGHRYDNWIPTQKGTVGYYSHGTWLRMEQQHGASGEGDLDAEIRLLPVLAEILKKHKQFQVLIFLHPKEKKYQPQEKVRNYYGRIFAGINFSFADESLSSTMQFEKAEIGIGAISTILFERIFTGYKTIMYPLGVKDFPVSGSNFHRACATNPEQLEEYLLDAAGKEEDAYFSGNGLAKYTRREWMKKND